MTGGVSGAVALNVLMDNPDRHTYRSLDVYFRTCDIYRIVIMLSRNLNPFPLVMLDERTRSDIPDVPPYTEEEETP